MSVRLWSYEPEKCDGQPCPGECGICNKADWEHDMPAEVALRMLEIWARDRAEGQKDTEQ